MTKPDVYQLASEAVADPRSIRRALRGEWVARSVGERIRVVFERHGIKVKPSYQTE